MSDRDDRPAMELGLYTFAELTPDAGAGATVTPAQRLRDLVEEVELADQVGLDVFGVGEHHRPDFAVSAPAVVLAAAAERTVAHPADQRGQRALAPTTRCACSRSSRRSTCSRAGAPRSWPGAGSFIESFPLFGYDLDDYDELFAEKLDLLLALRDARAGDLVGPPARADRRPRRLPAAAAGPAAGVDRGRRHAQLGGAGRACWGCRWRSRSSAARRSASRRSPSCTGARRAEAGHERAAA